MQAQNCPRLADFGVRLDIFKTHVTVTPQQGTAHKTSNSGFKNSLKILMFTFGEWTLLLPDKSGFSCATFFVNFFFCCWGVLGLRGSGGSRRGISKIISKVRGGQNCFRDFWHFTGIQVIEPIFGTGFGHLHSATFHLRQSPAWFTESPRPLHWHCLCPAEMAYLTPHSLEILRLPPFPWKTLLFHGGGHPRQDRLRSESYDIPSPKIWLRFDKGFKWGLWDGWLIGSRAHFWRAPDPCIISFLAFALL